jgi:hypothetical protein
MIGTAEPGGAPPGVDNDGAVPPAAPTLRALWALAATAERWLCFAPPSMDARWHPDFERRLAGALDAGGGRGSQGAHRPCA